MNLSKYTKVKQAGFTLLELLMVIAVIGILATIAVPRLQNYSNKARFTEVVNSVAPYKAAVEICLLNNVATACNAGAFGIPAGFNTVQGRVASVDVAGGVITATGTADVNGATYQLTPTLNANSVTWVSGGTCQAQGLCN